MTELKCLGQLHLEDRGKKKALGVSIIYLDLLEPPSTLGLLYPKSPPLFFIAIANHQMICTCQFSCPPITVRTVTTNLHIRKIRNCSRPANKPSDKKVAKCTRTRQSLATFLVLIWCLGSASYFVFPHENP